MRKPEVRVPREAFAHHVERYLEGAGQDEYCQADSFGPRVSPRDILAREAGIPPNSLYQVLQGRMHTISRERLDRLFCAMGTPHLWWKDEVLNGYYLMPDVEVQVLSCRRCGGHTTNKVRICYTCRPGNKARARQRAARRLQAA